jgi:hypothetical protein
MNIFIVCARWRIRDAEFPCVGNPRKEEEEEEKKKKKKERSPLRFDGVQDN